MTYPRYTRIAQSLPATVPFVGPEAHERATGITFTARIGANENVFGPSPKAIKAMSDSLTDIWCYGESENHELRHALAAHLSIKPTNVMIGEGIDGLLGYLVRLLIEPGDAVVTSDGAYPTFNYHVAGFGGVLHKVPYRDDHEDLPALIKKAHETGAKLVYFANPDNPMGTWTKGKDVVQALDDLPEGCLLVLDEAYGEFAPEEAQAPVNIDDPRVIRMRTFSKAYGLAGARVGYALGAEELIGSFNKIRNHFGMNRSAQIGALAALEDQAYLRETVENVEKSRVRIAEIAAANGLGSVPSASNFVAVDCGKDGVFAKAVLDGLVAQGLFVRMPFAAPQNRCIRISCGTDKQLDLLEKALPVALQKAKG